MIPESVRVQFHYNRVGLGDLILTVDDSELLRYTCRTGSIGLDMNLKNAIPVQPWYLCSGPEAPVKAEENLMFVKGCYGIPWKQCLWPIPEYSAHARTGNHYLIHPDGSKEHLKDGNGTDGCIGLVGSNGAPFYHYMRAHFAYPEPAIIPVEVCLV